MFLNGNREITMSHVRIAARLAAVSAAFVVLAPAALAADKILEFDTMEGVVAPYTGSANPIRGLNGGGRPWILRSGKGEVKSDGRVEVKVRGLVLTSTGVNPAANFRVVVSCLSVNGAGEAVTVNVSTGDHPATPTGDAEIEAALELPAPCIAPILFVTSSTGAWFAATGG
jgi:hypothetical protein